MTKFHANADESLGTHNNEENFILKLFDKKKVFLLREKQMTETRFKYIKFKRALAISSTCCTCYRIAGARKSNTYHNFLDTSEITMMRKNQKPYFTHKKKKWKTSDWLEELLVIQRIFLCVTFLTILTINNAFNCKEAWIIYLYHSIRGSYSF